MQIKTFKPSDHKIKGLVYGRSGSGKTVFGGTAPKPLILSAENGLLSLATSGLQVDVIEIKTLANLKEALLWLQKPENNSKYETLIIDSITEINEIIKEELSTRLKRRMQLQDWGVLADEIKHLLRSMKSLPMHVLYIAQERDVTDGDNIDKKVPSLNGGAATSICYDVDIVGYIEVQKDGSRVLITNAHPKLLTKDRSNCIGNDTELDFSVWVEKVKSIAVGTSNVVVDEQVAKNDAKTGVDNAVTTPTLPTTPTPSKNPPESKERQKLHKQLHATWNEYAKLSKIPKQNSEVTRIATIEKHYKVKSSLDMTDEQLEDMCMRLKSKIVEIENTAKFDAMMKDQGITTETPKVETPTFTEKSPEVIYYMENYAMTAEEAIKEAIAVHELNSKSTATQTA